MFNIYLETLVLDSCMVWQPAANKMQFFPISGEIIINLSNQLKKKKVNFDDLLKNN